MKQLTDTNLMARALGLLARAIFRYRWYIVYPQVALFVFCVFYTIKFLEFDTKRSNLVGANKKYQQNFIKFRDEFQSQDDVVVVVESEDTEKNRQFVERLGPKLEAEPKVFQHVFYKGDLKMLGSKALLFVPEADLRTLQKKLADYKPFLQDFTKATNLVSLFKMMNRQFRTADRTNNASNESLIGALPAMERILRQARESMDRLGAPPSPGVTALFSSAQADNEMYLTFGGGRIYLVTVQAPSAAMTQATVKRLRELVEETRVEVPGLNIGLTGEPVLEVDEMAQSQRDTTIATVVSLVLCALIFIYGYNETGRPIKATLCLIVGVAYTMAFTTLVIGHLNVLTIIFVPILIGMGIDFGVHLITRYEEELRHGKTEEQALTKALVFTGQGIFTGAFTTAGAFLAMAFTDFRGIQEMGIICGCGLLICLIPMLTILPVLILRGRQNLIDHVQGDPEDRRARLENIWLSRPAMTFTVAVVLCGLCLTQTDKVYFDYNLLNMQSKGLPAVEFEKKLIHTSETYISASNSRPRSVLYAAVIATNLAQASMLEQQLTNLPAVAGVESMTSFLLEDQTTKLALVDEIKRDMAPLKFSEVDPEKVDLNLLSTTLYSFYGYLEIAIDAVEGKKPKLASQLSSLHATVADFRVQLHGEKPGRTEAGTRTKLTAFQRALFEDIRSTFQSMQSQDTSAPLRVEDLPASLRDRFIGLKGNYLLMVKPRKNVWERKNQKELIEQIRTVDPNVTGTPVQLYEYTTLLRKSYEEAALYSLIAIMILVFIHFHTISAVLLSLTPVVVGSLWLGGVMGLLDLPFNPANIMTLPLMIGVGVTNGVHILNRFAEEQTPSILARSTGKAVLVSGLTTIAGFASLMLGKHQGIQTLGSVMSIGLTTCMVAGLTFLPALLNLIIRFQQWRRGGSPQDSSRKNG